MVGETFSKAENLVNIRNFDISKITQSQYLNNRLEKICLEDGG